MVKKISFVLLIVLWLLSVATISSQQEVALPAESSVNAEGTIFSSDNIQESVDIYDGSLKVLQTDASIQGVGGLGFSLTRKYNSNIWQVFGQPRSVYEQGVGGGELRGGEIGEEYISIPGHIPVDNPFYFQGYSCGTLENDDRYGWEGDAYEDWLDRYERELEEYRRNCDTDATGRITYCFVPPSQRGGLGNGYSTEHSSDLLNAADEADRNGDYREGNRLFGEWMDYEAGAYEGGGERPSGSFVDKGEDGQYDQRAGKYFHTGTPDYSGLCSANRQGRDSLGNEGALVGNQQNAEGQLFGIRQNNEGVGGEGNQLGRDELEGASDPYYIFLDIRGPLNENFNRAFRECYSVRDRLNRQNRVYDYLIYNLNPNVIGDGFGVGWLFDTPKISADVVYINNSIYHRNGEISKTTIKPKIVYPGGAIEYVLFNNQTNEIFTESLSKVKINNNYSVEVVTGSGMRYVFEWYSRSFDIRNRLPSGVYPENLAGGGGFIFERFLYLTKIEDEFGNWIKVRYFSPAGIHLPYVEEIETSSGQKIWFDLKTGPEIAESGEAGGLGAFLNRKFFPPTQWFATMSLDSMPIYYYANAKYSDFNGENISVKYNYDFYRVNDMNNRYCYSVSCNSYTGHRELYPGACIYGFLTNVSYYKEEELLAPPTIYEYDTDIIETHLNNINIDRIIPYDMKKLIYPSGLEVNYSYYRYNFREPLSQQRFYQRRIASRTIDNDGEIETWRYGTKMGIVSVNRQEQRVQNQNFYVYSESAQTNPLPQSPNDNIIIETNAGRFALKKSAILKPDNTLDVIYYFPILCMSDTGECDDLSGANWLDIPPDSIFLREMSGLIYVQESYGHPILNERGEPTERPLISVSYKSYTPRYLGSVPTPYLNYVEGGNRLEFSSASAPKIIFLPQSEVTEVFGDNGDGDNDFFDDVKYYAVQYRNFSDNNTGFSNFNYLARNSLELSREISGDYDKYLNNKYNINYGEISNPQIHFQNFSTRIDADDDIHSLYFPYNDFVSNWISFENADNSDDIININTYVVNNPRGNNRAISGLARAHGKYSLLDNSAIYNKTSNGELNLISQNNILYGGKRGNQRSYRNVIIVPSKKVSVGLRWRDSNGNLVRDSGITSSFTFNSNGLVETQNTNNGASYDLFVYDDKGRIVEAYNCLNTAERHCNPRDAPSRAKLVSTFRYYPNGLLKEIKDSEDLTARYLYDSFNRLIKVSKDDTWNENWEATQPNVIYNYDNFRKTLSITQKKDDDSYLYPSYYFYDKKGRLIQTRQFAGNEGVFVSSIKYDFFGNTIYATKNYFDNNPVTNYVAPDFDLLFSENKSTKIFYDDLKRAIKTINFDGSYVSGVYGVDWIKGFNENNIAIKQESDAFGNLVKVIEDSEEQNPDLRTFNYKYDPLKRLTEIKDAEERVSTNAYDSHSRIVSSTHPDTGTSTIRYKTNGLIESTTDALERTTRTNYDRYNRISSIVYSDGTSINYGYDWCYDWKLCNVEWAGGYKIFEYDNLGRIKNEHLSVDETIISIDYFYDIAGNLVKEEVYSYYETDGEVSPVFEFSIIYEYDNLNRVKRVQSKIGEDEQPKTISTFSYTPQGQIGEIIYGNFVKGDYDYNTRELLKLINTLGLREGEGEGRALRGAEGGGELIVNAFFTRFYEYDSIGNLVKLRNGTFQNSPVLAEFEYDTLDRLTSVRDNNYYGESQEYSYDNTGNRLSLTTNQNGVSSVFSYNYDSPYNNQLSRVRLANNDFISLDYDVVGNVIRKTSAGNNPISFVYNANNMVKGVDLDGDNRVDENHSYDFANMRVKKIESDKITYYFRDLSGNAIYEFCRGRGCVSLTCSPENFNWSGSKFTIQDSEGNNISIIDESGMMMIKGGLQEFSEPEGDNFIITNNAGRVASWIDSTTGDLYLNRYLNENTNALPLNNSNEFRIQSSRGEDIAWFDDRGNLYLKSCLVSNYDFEQRRQDIQGQQNIIGGIQGQQNLQG